jgi:hypothetical protein
LVVAFVGAATIGGAMAGAIWLGVAAKVFVGTIVRVIIIEVDSTGMLGTAVAVSAIVGTDGKGCAELLVDILIGSL